MYGHMFVLLNNVVLLRQKSHNMNWDGHYFENNYNYIGYTKNRMRQQQCLYFDVELEVRVCLQEILQKDYTSVDTNIIQPLFSFCNIRRGLP